MASAALTGLVEAIDDPCDRYWAASSASELHRAAVSLLSQIRAEAVAEMHAGGESYAAIAARTELTRARVQQMVERARL